MSQANQRRVSLLFIIGDRTKKQNVTIKKNKQKRKEGKETKWHKLLTYNFRLAANILLRLYYYYSVNKARFLMFLPRDAMRKRGLCCSPVSICSSVLSCLWIVSTRLKISSNFLLGPVAHHSSFFDPQRQYPIPKETPSAGERRKIHGGGKIFAIFD